MTNKEWYDTEIAPKLLEIAQQCEAHGVSMIATVEYAPHEIGHTFTLQENAGLEIIAINHWIVGPEANCVEREVDMKPNFKCPKCKKHYYVGTVKGDATKGRCPNCQVSMVKLEGGMEG